VLIAGSIIVRAISPSANHQTRHILVFVDLPKHPELKAGTYAQGRFSLGERKALTVPQSSIVVRDGFNFVFVLQANEQVSQRKIEVGRYAQQRVEVLNGLSAQEKIAVKGAGFLNDGDTVKVVN
jgi:HlyD family secretion protein